MKMTNVKAMAVGAALGVGLLVVLAAVPSQTDFDATYFRTNALPITLQDNIALNGYLSLSGATNRVTMSGGSLQVDGSPVGGGGSLWTNLTGDIDGNGAVTNWIAAPTNKTVYIGSDWLSLNSDLQQEGIGKTLAIARKSSGGGTPAVSLSVDDPNSENAGFIIEDAWTDDGLGYMRNSMFVQQFHTGLGHFDDNQIMSSFFAGPLQSSTNGSLKRLVGYTSEPGAYNPFGAGQLQPVDWAIGFFSIGPHAPPIDITNACGFYASKAGRFDTLSGGPTVKASNAYGFYSDDRSQCGTNSYGFYSRMSVGDGSSWEFYGAGGAPSLLNGTTEITGNASLTPDNADSTALMWLKATNSTPYHLIFTLDGTASFGAAFSDHNGDFNLISQSGNDYTSINIRTNESVVVHSAVAGGTTFEVDGISKSLGFSTPATNFASEVVATNGITLGGVRQTSWPAGGVTGTVVTNGTAVSAGDIAAFGTASTNLAKATSAQLQAALGQVYQGTNAALTHYAGTDTNALLAAIGGVSKSGDTMTGTLGFSGSATLLNLPSLTTAQKNAATAIAGSQVYDSDLGRVQAYDGAAWHSRVRLDGDTMTGALVVPAGTAGAPSLGVGTTTNGVYSAGANTVGIATSGTGRWVVASDGTLGGATDGNYNIGTFATSRPLTITAVHVNSSDYFGFTGFGGYLRNPASQVYSFEVDAASPNNAALRGASGVGTDKNGGSLTLEGGQSTGTGRAGSLIVRTATTSTTGSSANAYQERAHYIPKYVDLTDNTATTLFTVALPATNSVGIQFVCTIQASDGTDFQSLTTPVTVDAVAKTTTITAVVAPTAAQTALAGSGGTLSVTYTVVDAGSNVLAVKVTADTSFGSPTYLRAKIVMTAINGVGAGWSITEI